MNNLSYESDARMLWKPAGSCLNYTVWFALALTVMWFGGSMWAAWHSGRAIEVIRHSASPDMPAAAQRAGCGDIADPVAQGACVVDACQQEGR